jgi:hypothetical protein
MQVLLPVLLLCYCCCSLFAAAVGDGSVPALVGSTTSAVMTASVVKVPRPKAPFRAYSFTPNTTIAALYTGSNMNTDMGRSATNDTVRAMLAMGVVPLKNAAGPSVTGRHCEKERLNHTACVEAHAHSVQVLRGDAAAAADGIEWSGRSINEWTLHNSTHPTKEPNATLDYPRAAAEGYRLARARDPELFLAGWITNPDDTFASLMADGTFDTAMVEGYSFCPVFNCSRPVAPDCKSIPGEWGSCGHSVESYLPRLEWARRAGFINRTIFSFGWLIAESPAVPHGWTPAKLRAEATKLKTQFPEMPGCVSTLSAHECGICQMAFVTKHSVAKPSLIPYASVSASR